MSESERGAWQQALYGTEQDQRADIDVEEGWETVSTDTSDVGFGAGCQGQAFEAEYGDQSRSQELWEQVQPAVEEMRQRVDADPRVVEADMEWSACMAEAGHELESRNGMWDTVQEEFQRRLTEIVGSQADSHQAGPGGAEQGSDEVDMAAVEALQREEIDMALADLKCAESWDDAYAEVRAEYKAAFIPANLELLEQIRAAQGG